MLSFLFLSSLCVASASILQALKGFNASGAVVYFLQEKFDNGSVVKIPLQLEWGGTVCHSVREALPKLSQQYSQEEIFRTMNVLSSELYEMNYSPCCTRCSAMENEASRHTIVDYLRKRFAYKRYLEIGCDLDQVFAEVGSQFAYRVGVDPEKGGTHRMTSDAFFEANREHFDLIFIDGLHEANQVVRDVYNALRWLSANGTIVLHDANPQGPEVEASFPRREEAVAWNGDTWKAIVALRLAEDLEIVVVDIDHGVAVLRRRFNDHPLPGALRKQLGVNPISVLRHEHLLRHRTSFLRLISLVELEEWLRVEEQE